MAERQHDHMVTTMKRREEIEKARKQIEAEMVSLVVELSVASVKLHEFQRAANRHAAVREVNDEIRAMCERVAETAIENLYIGAIETNAIDEY